MFNQQKRFFIPELCQEEMLPTNLLPCKIFTIALTETERDALFSELETFFGTSSAFFSKAQRPQQKGKGQEIIKQALTEMSASEKFQQCVLETIRVVLMFLEVDWHDPIGAAQRFLLEINTPEKIEIVLAKAREWGILDQIAFPTSTGLYFLDEVAGNPNLITSLSAEKQLIIRTYTLMLT